MELEKPILATMVPSSLCGNMTNQDGGARYKQNI